MLCAPSLLPTPSDGRGGREEEDRARQGAGVGGRDSRHGRHQAGGRGTHFTAYVSPSLPFLLLFAVGDSASLSLSILHNCQKVINRRRRPLFLSPSVSIVKLCARTRTCTALCPCPFLPQHARRCLPSSAFISCRQGCCRDPTATALLPLLLRGRKDIIQSIFMHSEGQCQYDVHKIV